MRKGLMLFGIFISVLIISIVMGALIGCLTVLWPRIEEGYWFSLGTLPPGEISRVFAGGENIYVEMADGTKYLYQRESGWSETANVVQSDPPSPLCPRLRPRGMVAAEFCYARGSADRIIVVLEEGTVWRREIYKGDNYQGFKILELMLRMIQGGVIGGLVGVFIMMILFGGQYYRKKKKLAELESLLRQ